MFCGLFGGFVSSLWWFVFKCFDLRFAVVYLLYRFCWFACAAWVDLVLVVWGLVLVGLSLFSL